MRRCWFVAFVVVVSIFASVALAQSTQRPSRHYDQLTAGQESYRLQEQQRLFRIGRQLQLNDEMVFWSTSFPAWRYFAEPWPFLPGDIYGYPLAEPPINQPIGRAEYPIGKNRSLSTARLCRRNSRCAVGSYRTSWAAIVLTLRRQRQFASIIRRKLQGRT